MIYLNCIIFYLRKKYVVISCMLLLIYVLCINNTQRKMVNRKRKVCSFTLDDKTIDRINDIVAGKFNVVPRSNLTKSELIEILIDRLYIDKEPVLVAQLKELEKQKALLQDKIDIVSQDLSHYLDAKKEADVKFSYTIGE